jgi:hypothetical protein
MLPASLLKRSDNLHGSRRSTDAYERESARGYGIYSAGGGSPHLARRLTGPALECMRECAHLMKAEQPRNLGYMQLLVIEVLLKRARGAGTRFRIVICPLDPEVSVHNR